MTIEVKLNGSAGERTVAITPKRIFNPRFFGEGIRQDRIRQDNPESRTQTDAKRFVKRG